MNLNSTVGGIKIVHSMLRATQRGVSKLTLIVFGAIIFVVGYSAYQILPFYYCFYELQNNMESIIKIANEEPDEVIRRRLMTHIRELGIPMGKPENLQIERDAGIMKIRLKYKEVFYVTFRGKDYDLQVFDFDARAVGKIQ